MTDMPHYASLNQYRCGGAPNVFIVLSGLQVQPSTRRESHSLTEIAAKKGRGVAPNCQ